MFLFILARAFAQGRAAGMVHGRVGRFRLRQIIIPEAGRHLRVREVILANLLRRAPGLPPVDIEPLEDEFPLALIRASGLPRYVGCQSKHFLRLLLEILDVGMLPPRRIPGANLVPNLVQVCLGPEYMWVD